VKAIVPMRKNRRAGSADLRDRLKRDADEIVVAEGAGERDKIEQRVKASSESRNGARKRYPSAEGNMNSGEDDKIEESVNENP
jgi:hypothetical protein